MDLKNNTYTIIFVLLFFCFFSLRGNPSPPPGDCPNINGPEAIVLAAVKSEYWKARDQGSLGICYMRTAADTYDIIRYNENPKSFTKKESDSFTSAVFPSISLSNGAGRSGRMMSEIFKEESSIVSRIINNIREKKTSIFKSEKILQREFKNLDFYVNGGHFCESFEEIQKNGACVISNDIDAIFTHQFNPPRRGMRRTDVLKEKFSPETFLSIAPSIKQLPDYMVLLGYGMNEKEKNDFKSRNDLLNKFVIDNFARMGLLMVNLIIKTAEKKLKSENCSSESIFKRGRHFIGKSGIDTLQTIADEVPDILKRQSLKKLEVVFRQACSKQLERNKDHYSCKDVILKNLNKEQKKTTFLNDINVALASQLPIPISYYVSSLINHDRFKHRGAHISQIIGTQSCSNKKGEQEKYVLVQNTWGDGGQYPESAPLISEKNGSFWVKVSDLIPQMMDYSLLKRTNDK